VKSAFFRGDLLREDLVRPSVVGRSFLDFVSKPI
jgi:hypothetical protein